MVVLDNYFTSKDEIQQLMNLQPPVRMERTKRLLVCRSYVNYVRTAYKRMFNSVHVHADVIGAVAKVLIRNFPSMCDLNSTQENPTYVCQQS